MIGGYQLGTRKFLQKAAAIVFSTSGLVAGILVLALLPLLMPWLELFRVGGWQALGETNRLLLLTSRTLQLIGWTLLFALPLGTGLSLLLFRTTLPGRHFFLALLAVSFFVPLPIHATAWQTVLREFGWGTGTVWNQGILCSAWIHGLMGLPWVVGVVGVGLLQIPRNLEEDALLAIPWPAVWLRVTLPQVFPFIVLAGISIALQVSGEIVVTDLMNVRTFAEEVYTQFVTAGEDDLGRAVAVALPWTVFCFGIVWWLVPPFTRQPLKFLPTRPLRFHLGRSCWFFSIGIGLFLLGLTLVPLGALCWQTAGGSQFESGSMRVFLREFGQAWKVHGELIVDSLFWSCVANFLAIVLALSWSWGIQSLFRHRPFGFGIELGGVLTCWVITGPILGYGVQATIHLLMTIEEWGLPFPELRPFRWSLYDANTPLPVLWVQALKLFPLAWMFLHPAKMRIPAALWEATILDGGSTWQRFRYVSLPYLLRPVLLILLIGTLLNLGEVSASKMVQVPGRPTFSQELFQQLHYGVTRTTSALCLVQWSITTLLVALFVIGLVRSSRR